jgi:hypothetical protein
MFADRSKCEFYQRRNRTILADALHHVGQREHALTLFCQAEDMQSDHEPFPLLYSLLGSRYCELLLSPFERAAWQHSLGTDSNTDVAIADCYHVTQRALQMLEWRQPEDSWVEIAHDHLTLGRAALCVSVLDETATGARETANRHVGTAVMGFYRAGQQEYYTQALLARAWLHSLHGNPSSARADLEEAWQIAERGMMRLRLADIPTKMN